MEAEEATGQAEPDQTQDTDLPDSGGEALADVVEGFEEQPADDASEEPDEDSPEKPDEKGETKQDPDEREQKIQQLEKQVNQMGYALRQAQKQQKQEGSQQQQEEESLTPDQLKGLIAEHKDDPNTLYNIMEYIGKQSAKSASKETMDAQRVSTIKQQADAYVSQAFPELTDDSSPAKQKVSEIKSHFMLGDHPAGDYFAASALIADNIDTIKQQAFEQGRQEGLKGKAESKRKESVEDKTLVSSKKSGPKKTGGVSSAHAKTFKQMGLSPSQQKIAESLLSKNTDHAEA